jgi:hypothetical protein
VVALVAPEVELLDAAVAEDAAAISDSFAALAEVSAFASSVVPSV